MSALDVKAPQPDTANNQPEALRRFGRQNHLAGMVTHAACAIDRSVGVIMLNAGVISRMGPHRFNVKLARRLARHGYTSLRFDLSGQGDSDASTGPLDYHEQTIQDLRDALDQLQRDTGLSRFVVVGICSGAQGAWHASLRDERIVGLVAIDGHVYPTRWTSLAHRWRRLCERSIRGQADIILLKLSNQLARLTGKPRRPASKMATTASRVAGSDDDTQSQRTTAPQYAEGMQKLADRGVKSLIVFTSGWMAYYSYANQFNAVFGKYPFARKVRVEFAPHLDHTLTLLESQQALFEWIELWIEEC